MSKLERKWTLDLIHHSHTDIGYTERQEKIERYHIHFIKQAIHILDQIYSGQKPEWKGFKWVCETFWAVERFLEQASEAEASSFAKYVRSGDISLSGTYLNMTELADASLIQQLTRRSTEYGRSIGTTVDSAMTADINGYGWGYAQCLLDEGIEHLFTCIHTQHGMFPLGKKQTPFWWETPSKERLLVWSGDHYNLGNDLGLVPNALHSYIIRDEFHTKYRMDLEEQWTIMENRVFRYLRKLEEEGYPYDFVPIAISGLIVDNAPPNAHIMDWLARWNAEHGDVVSIQLTTLSDFFHKLKNVKGVDIPTYSGDWPDWWSDGTASTATATKMYRDANRQLSLLKSLNPGNEHVASEEIRRIEDQLALYAEHTWGYSHSILEPWNPLTQALRARKEAYATEASRLVYRALDQVFELKGEAMLSPERPLRYKVVNPYEDEVTMLAKMYVDYWEFPMIEHSFEVIDEHSGRTLPHQLTHVSRGAEVSVKVTLAKQAEKTYRIQATRSVTSQTTSSFDLIGCDGVEDLSFVHRNHANISVTTSGIESSFLKIQWETDVGIVSWFDKTLNMELIDCTAIHTAFTPVYEVTPVPTGADMIYRTRVNMGRNKKGMHVKRSVGKLVQSHIVERGELWTTIELCYEVDGMRDYRVVLKVYHDSATVHASVRLHKDSVWEPENVYVSLPFYFPSSELWIAKTGANVRAGIDQLPGTCLDFYSLQEGLVWSNDREGLSIALPDAPLIQVGPLDYGVRKLMGQQNTENSQRVYSWILNNVWETNFNASLGGFYEFNYIVSSGEPLKNIDVAFEQCRRQSQQTVCFRV